MVLIFIFCFEGFFLFEKERKNEIREVERIWQELGEGKENDQNILCENDFN